MTPNQADALAPQVKLSLEEELMKRCYQSIFINLGQSYLPTVRGVTYLHSAEWATGAIGIRAAALKDWLSRTAH